MFVGVRARHDDVDEAIGAEDSLHANRWGGIRLVPPLHPLWPSRPPHLAIPVVTPMHHSLNI